MSRIYLAGPITGNPQYREQFREAAQRFRSVGHDVLDPTEHFGGRDDLPYHAYLRAAVQAILVADAIAVLPGWENSRGASFEKQLADLLGLTVYDAYNSCRDGSPLIPEELGQMAKRAWAERLAGIEPVTREQLKRTVHPV